MHKLTLVKLAQFLLSLESDPQWSALSGHDQVKQAILTAAAVRFLFSREVDDGSGSIGG